MVIYKCKTISSLLILNALACNSYAEELWFPESLINESGSDNTDLSALLNGHQNPGVYSVDIFFNQGKITNRDVEFISSNESADNTGLIPCISTEEWLQFGIKAEFLPATSEAPNQCVSLKDSIPSATIRFDFEKLALHIDVPQIALNNKANGWIPPESWDNGITAAYINYYASGQRGSTPYSRNEHRYLRLENGINMGAWRIRDDRTWTESSVGGITESRWQHGNTYIERAIIPLKSRLTLGDSTTEGNIFDSVAMRGAQLLSEDAMYPDSQRGYAPVIRGTALTNAQVLVRQNGYLIYQLNVAPGDFVIDDLYPMYSSGDLQVTVIESDGSSRINTIPYSAAPLMIREGRYQYAIAAGKLRNNLSNEFESPTFLQATFSVGLPGDITSYSGVQYSEKYKSGLVGAGINLGSFGAVSGDLTHAKTELSNKEESKGQSLRLLYSRSLNETGTTFQLAGYRYSTKGFYSFNESAYKNSTINETDNNVVYDYITNSYNRNDIRKQQLQLNISQSLSEIGSIYITGTRQTYWNKKTPSDSLIVGFNGYYRDVSYSMSVNHSKYAGNQGSDRSLFMSLSFPFNFGRVLNRNPINVNLSASRDNNGTLTQQTGLSGLLLEQRNLSWSVNQNYSKEDSGGSASASYQGSYNNSSVGYSYNKNYHQLSYSTSGSILGHADGITLGRPIGNSAILVEAKGAAGIELQNSNGIKTDWRGYAISPWANNYRLNRVALDNTSLDNFIEVQGSVDNVVPTRGAIVKSSFATVKGYRALFTLKHNGKPLPFGSTVVASGNYGLVDDEGNVFLSGLPDTGELTASWGSKEFSCKAEFDISNSESEHIIEKTLTCL